MAVILQDPTRPRDPSSRHAFPDVVPKATLEAPRTLAEELLSVTDQAYRPRQSSIDIALDRSAEYHALEGAFGWRAVTERAKAI